LIDKRERIVKGGRGGSKVQEKAIRKKSISIWDSDLRNPAEKKRWEGNSSKVHCLSN